METLESNSTNSVDHTIDQDRSYADNVEVLMYCISLFVGGPLNIAALYKFLPFWRGQLGDHPKSGSQITLLKMHLNIADLITVFIYAPSQIIWMITFQWFAGDILCRVIKFFHTFGFYLNAFVVSCFAIDRLYCLCSLSSLRTPTIAYKRVQRLLAVAWILAFLLSLPQCYIFQIFQPSELHDFRQCTPIWTIIMYEVGSKMSILEVNDVQQQILVERLHLIMEIERAYNIIHLLFVFWIPTFIIVISYCAILCILNSFASSDNRRESYIDRSPHKDEGTEEERYRYETQRASLHSNPETPHSKRGTVGPFAFQTILMARKNAKKHAALILLAYLVIWSPYNVLALINSFIGKESKIRELTSDFLPFFNSLIVINPIINPLIYGTLKCPY